MLIKWTPVSCTVLFFARKLFRRYRYRYRYFDGFGIRRGWRPELHISASSVSRPCSRRWCQSRSIRQKTGEDCQIINRPFTYNTWNFLAHLKCVGQQNMSCNQSFWMIKVLMWIEREKLVFIYVTSSLFQIIYIFSVRQLSLSSSSPFFKFKCNLFYYLCKNDCKSVLQWNEVKVNTLWLDKFILTMVCYNGFVNDLFKSEWKLLFVIAKWS